MTWVREYLWILVIVGIIVAAGIISIIMICVCRTQLSRGLSQRFQKSFSVKRKSNVMQDRVHLENSIYHMSGNEPRLPTTDVLVGHEDTTHTYARIQLPPKQEVSFRDVTGQRNRQSNSAYVDVLSEDEDNEYDDAIVLPGVFYNAHM